jgi:hypothetical protein
MKLHQVLHSNKLRTVNYVLVQKMNQPIFVKIIIIVPKSVFVTILVK